MLWKFLTNENNTESNNSYQADSDNDIEGNENLKQENWTSLLYLYQL